MDFSKALKRASLFLLSTLITTPASAAVFDSQWALVNTGQKVCNFRGEKCTEGRLGIDIKYKLVESRRDCSRVTVAVLDSGVDLHHPDLEQNLLPGKSFVGDAVTDDPQDDNLHGTHVAGIIAGAGNEAGGVVGVCARARVLPVKVGDAEGYLTDADILEGIQFAVAKGARVINGSFGGSQPSMAVKNVIAKARNTLFVFAAGNGDPFTGVGFDVDKRPVYPAGYGLANILVVAATDASDQLGKFSNFGAKTVGLAAPGVNIVSSLPMKATAEMQTYGIPAASGPLDGTSMATPYVAGAATLALSANPKLTISALKTKLLQSVDKVEALAGKTQSGGRLNLAKLMGVSR